MPGLGRISGGPEGAQAGADERGPRARWAQFRLGPSKWGHQVHNLSRFSPRRPTTWVGGALGGARRSQVQLVGFDVLELLPELQEGGPRGGIQVPAVLHDLVDRRRAAVGGVHLVALLHPRDDVLQGLWAGGWGQSVQGLTPLPGGPDSVSGIPFRPGLQRQVQEAPGKSRGRLCGSERKAGPRMAPSPAQPSLAPKASPSAPAMPRPQHPTHNSWIRHSPKRVDFPEEDSETPHIRLGGEFLPCGWGKQCQVLGAGDLAGVGGGEPRTPIPHSSGSGETPVPPSLSGPPGLST